MLATFTLSPTETQIVEPSALKTQLLAVYGPSIRERYQIVKQLYKAEVGNTVVSVVRPLEESHSTSLYILKEIDLSYLNETHLQQSRSEFIIQMSLQHENIVRCLEYEETNGQMLAVLELVNKPEYLQVELDDNLEAITNEFMLKTFMSELLEAVAYMHGQSVVHCDIKVENILAEQKVGQNFPSLKLCDFGLSRKVDSVSGKVYIDRKMGTKDYMAPEVKDKAQISTKIDIFSLGLVFYKMCTTYLPSQINRDWVSKGLPVPFRESDWTDHNRGDELRSLISQMLSVDPTQRPSAEECLKHAYFNIEA